MNNCDIFAIADDLFGNFIRGDEIARLLKKAYAEKSAEKRAEKKTEPTGIGICYCNGPAPAITRSFLQVPEPVKAIFNVKTEEEVPLLDDDGNEKYAELRPGENPGARRKLKTTRPLDRPVLATKVTFSDGSWTVVKNSGDDEIGLVEVKLPDGRTVMTADDASKERAIAYAFIKRAFGKVDPATKETTSANLGRRFEKLLAESFDQTVSKAKAEAERNMRRARTEDKGKTEKTEKKPEAEKPKAGDDDIKAAEDAAVRVLNLLAERLGLDKNDDAGA